MPFELVFDLCHVEGGTMREFEGWRHGSDPCERVSPSYEFGRLADDVFIVLVAGVIVARVVNGESGGSRLVSERLSCRSGAMPNDGVTMDFGGFRRFGLCRGSAGRSN